MATRRQARRHEGKRERVTASVTKTEHRRLTELSRRLDRPLSHLLREHTLTELLEMADREIEE